MGSVSGLSLFSCEQELGRGVTAPMEVTHLSLRVALGSPEDE